MFDPTQLTVVVGYDEREKDAWLVCRDTLIKNSSEPINVIPLKHKDLRRSGWFDRPWSIEETTGNYKDERDFKNFSTQFSHTRFITPEFVKSLGSKRSYTVFVDCDFVFYDDIGKLVAEAQATEKPLCVVKHDFTPEEGTKMDGQEQQNYPCKLWSSLMVFDLDWEGWPTKEDVNDCSGAYLHRFQWMDKEDIGELSQRWNWIPDHSESFCPIEQAGAVHFTHGVPTVSDSDVSYGDRYVEELTKLSMWDFIRHA